MSEASRMSTPTTCAATCSATSSRASVSGPTPCAPPDGRMSAPSGPAPAPASLTARQAKALGLLMSGTYGRTGNTSSMSAALQSSLESRLRARLPISGPISYKMTWKPWVTPSGRSRFRLRASALRTSETGSTGWPTATMGDSRGTRNSTATRHRIPPSGIHAGHTLVDAASLSTWPTAAARDWKSSASNKHGDNARPLNEVARLANWATPAANSFEHKDVDAMLAQRERCRIQSNNGNGFGLSLGQMAGLATGAMSNGSPAATVSGGQLNPAHSRWLMGLPSEWDACGVTAMQSLRRPRKSGSKPAAKRSKAKPWDGLL